MKETQCTDLGEERKKERERESEEENSKCIKTKIILLVSGERKDQ